MNRKETVEFVNMCMIKNGDQVLVQDRVNPDWPGITFPGGHVEWANPLSMLSFVKWKKKLVWPFPNPNSVVSKNWYDDKDYRYVVLFYKTEHFSGELQSSDEGKFGGRTLKIFLI